VAKKLLSKIYFQIQGSSGFYCIRTVAQRDH